MISGAQWDCACGTSNLTLRTRCRDCGGPKADATRQRTAIGVMAAVRALQDTANEEEVLAAEAAPALDALDLEIAEFFNGGGR